MLSEPLVNLPHLKLSGRVRKALLQLREKLHEVYGTRLRGVYLYGSYARGEADEATSDVDVLIVLSGKVSPGQEIEKLNMWVSEIALEHDLLLSIYPVSEEWFEGRSSPFFLRVRKEAVPL